MACLSAGWASAAPPYVVTPLGGSVESLGDSKVFDINRYGQVVGWHVSGDGQRHATHWYNQSKTDLHGVPQFELLQRFTVGLGEAYGISDADQVVGTAQTIVKCPDRDITVYRSFILRPAVLTDLGTPLPGNALTDLGTFGNPCSAFNSAATAVSNANHVVGWAEYDNSATIRAFLVRPVNGVWFVDGDADFVNDLMIDLGTLGGAESSASDVNDSGQVVGWSYLPGSTAAYRAFLVTPVGTTWMVDAGGGRNTLMQDLGTLGGTNSWARAISNTGVVVGESDTANLETHAFRWANGVMTDLGTLGGRSSSAADVNDAGDVVGWAEDSNGNRRAFIWRNGQMQDLNSSLLVRSGNNTGGVTLTEARAISDDGQVAGFGTLGVGANAQPRAFLLRPATAAEIAAAEAEALLNPTVAGANSNDGSTGGSGTNVGTDVIPGTPNTLGPGNSGDAGEPNNAPATVGPALCGFGIASFLPVIGFCLWGMRRTVR